MSSFNFDYINFKRFKINDDYSISELEFCEQIPRVLRDHGLIPPKHLDYSGVICRVPDENKPNSLDGYFAIYRETRTMVGGNWRTGEKFIWRPSGPKPANSYQSANLKQNVSNNRNDKKNQIKCLEIWANCRKVDTHPYLTKKQIKPYFARQLGNKLVVPLFNTDGTLTGLQYIDELSVKRFGKGSTTKGSFCPLGMTVEPVPILICEGYATGCSLHEATNLPTLVTFSSGNLPVVAKQFQQKFPDRHLLICADNDYAQEVRDGKNPGVKAAEEAHRLTSGSICIPQFSEAIPGSDFNDIRVQYGLTSLREMLSPFLKMGG